MKDNKEWSNKDLTAEELAEWTAKYQKMNSAEKSESENAQLLATLLPFFK
jgi:hypothetical protein